MAAGVPPLLLSAVLLAAAAALAVATAPAVLVTDSHMTRMVALADRGATCTPSTDSGSSWGELWPLTSPAPTLCARMRRAYIRRAVLEAPRHMVREASAAGMASLLAACERQQQRGAGAAGGSSAGSGFLYPGTKWCGPGNSALGYHDLGELEAEDSCCREHDHCPSQLGSGECRHGLCNSSPFTRSHCDCDARFRRCLQTVNSEAAHTLGAVFFNVVQVMCFKEQTLCADSAEVGEARPCPAPEWRFRPSGKYMPLPPLF